MSRRVAAATLALLVGACTLDPNYTRPDLPVAQRYPATPKPETAPRSSEGDRSDVATVAADLGWRDFFADPALQRLIEISLANNRDARIAAINVAAARAQYQIQRADLFPAIDGSVSESVERTPIGVLASKAGGATGGAVTAGGGNHVIIRSYSSGIGFTAYELDLFGRIRSLSRQALEQYFGYDETRRSAIISLVAEVANGYLSVLADQDLLRVTRETLESQQASYELTKLGFQYGTQTQLTLRQAQISVDTARANLALYTRQLAQDRNALTLLLGAPIPDDLPFASGLASESLVEDLPAGLPSDLLERRPDVLAAEHNLLAANANIGAARAAFFPAISLTGNFGTASTDLSGLFKGSSRTWSFTPQISVPIFAGGANLANLELAKQQKNLQVATYEKTVQTAFREVSDSLVARGTLNDQIDAQVSLVAASQDAYDLSMLRFRAGVDSYLTTLDSQRSLYSAQQDLVTLKLSRLQNLVTLYKALGGGWNERTVSQAASAPVR